MIRLLLLVNVFGCVLGMADIAFDIVWAQNQHELFAILKEETPCQNRLFSKT